MKEGIYFRKSRKWHEPKTKLTVTKEGLAEETKMSDFLDALKVELMTGQMHLNDFLKDLRENIGSVTTVLTKKQFDTLFDAAVEKSNAKPIIISTRFNAFFDSAVARVIEGL